ncbi:EAL and HDOD domain-containing protein [Fundidesulfovibrio agrisoli]|uniref:EAL and HDOD domain-containing protein n=1 Tax=Fundidesulfovibrio agrisoli TaxID=2922717 RepID=UPI001FAB4CDD|nr:HDOD domain-containing protein [Fundidesulfovibrio agrisoli]
MQKNEEPETSPAELEQVFVARQPIFDREMKVWGYELLYRRADDSAEAGVNDDALATSAVIADGVTLGRAGLDPQEKTLVNFPVGLLCQGAGFALPRESCVIEILETVPPSPEVLKALHALKRAGYTLALDDFVGQPELEAFLPLADIVKVDVLALPESEAAGLVKRLRGGGRMLLAEKVEDEAMRARTLQMGFELFQGFFFQRPEIVSGSKMSTSQLTRVKLLGELSDEDFDPGRISRIIETDLSLSYRLLRYINSATFGRRDTVDSIRQAGMILGQRNLSKWLQAVLMADINPTPKGRELVFQSVRRAKFLELLGKNIERPPVRPDSLFVLGLFSLLDSLLGMPMDEVISGLPLAPALNQALLGFDGQARDLLLLAEEMEQADWRSAGQYLTELKLPASAATMLNADALRFAGELVREIQVLPPKGQVRR